MVFSRLRRLMAMSESGNSTDAYQNGKSGLLRDVDEPAITFDKATLSWSSVDNPILVDATFEIAQGELVMVVGPVGRCVCVLCFVSFLRLLGPCFGAVCCYACHCVTCINSMARVGVRCAKPRGRDLLPWSGTPSLTQKAGSVVQW